jgi:hypothetical protein
VIDRAFAVAQVDRLCGLNWFPRDAPALRELVQVIESASSERVAEHVLTEWLREERECPKPSDLRRLIHQENEKLERRTSGCPKCDGTGMIIVEINGFSGAKDCDCRKMHRPEGSSTMASDLPPSVEVHLSGAVPLAADLRRIPSHRLPARRSR